MDWLFERLIELAAWIAFILGVIFLVDAGYILVQWVRALSDGAADHQMLMKAGQAAGGFVLSTLVMGALACIDRYVFDAPQPPAK